MQRAFIEPQTPGTWALQFLLPCVSETVKNVVPKLTVLQKTQCLFVQV